MRSERHASPPPPHARFAEFGAAVSMPAHRVPTAITVEDEARLHDVLAEGYSSARFECALEDVKRELGRLPSVRVRMKARAGR